MIIEVGMIIKKMSNPHDAQQNVFPSEEEDVKSFHQNHKQKDYF